MFSPGVAQVYAWRGAWLQALACGTLMSAPSSLFIRSQPPRLVCRNKLRSWRRAGRVTNARTSRDSGTATRARALDGLGPSRQASFRLRLQQTPSSSHAVRLNLRTVISLGDVYRLLAPTEYKTKLCAGSPFNPPVPRAPSPVASARRAPSLLPSPCRRAISSWSSSIKACKWSGSIATTRGSCLGSLLCAGGLDYWAISR